MSKKILTVKYFNGGIGDSDKEGVKGSFYLSRNLDILSEPTNITLNPATALNSTTIVVDLVKWFVSGSPYDTNLYAVGDTGKIYKATSASPRVWSVLQTTSNCYGQGLELFNDYLYYTQNTQIGRYGLLSGTPSFTDAWQTGLNDTSAAGKRYAPIKTFANGLAVGHGNYLGWWDGTVWDVDRLIFPPGYNARTMDVIDEYLVIGTWKGSSITDSESGIAFFWDGTAKYYNFFVKIPEGGVQALINSRNRLMTIAGANGNLYLNSSPFQKVDSIPYLPTSKTVEIYPGAVANWQGVTLIGVAGNTDSSTLPQGVYQYGSKSDRYSEVLNLAYTPSHGKTAATTLHIGALVGLGDELFISWQDNTPTTITGVVFSNPSSTTVMGTKTNHGLGTGSIIVITGCTQTYANATWTVTKLTADTFTLDSALWASFTGSDVTGDCTTASTYGVDRVIITASPFATGSYQSLIFDDNRSLQEKLAITLVATHKALASGESIQLGYDTNRSGTYTTGSVNSTVGSVITRLPIQTSKARFYEFQFEVLLATSVATSPTVTSIGLEYDSGSETLV